MEIARLLKNLDNIAEAAKKTNDLSPAQNRAHQLPALFRPRHIKVLTNPQDPQHPTKGYFVGDDIQIGVGETPLEEMMHRVEEDMLNKTRRDLRQYLDMLTTKEPHGQEQSIEEDPTQNDSKADPDQQSNQTTTTQTVTVTPGQDRRAPGVSGSIPVESLTMEDGTVFNIYGNIKEGYTVGCGENMVPRKFSSLDHAKMATDLYRSYRARQQKQNSDYIDEH